MPPRHPEIARALGLVRRTLQQVAAQGRCRGADSCVRVLVACSGGADSVALLGLLALIAESDGLVVSVGHIDHGLRPESASEAEHVAAVAAGLGVEVRHERLELSRGAGLADRARTARHCALRSMARAASAGVLALGHTATDQAETVLLHLGRGAGLDGLSAMARAQFEEHDRLWVVRPLLDLAREEVRALAGHLNLDFVDDPTNLDPSQPRVAIRTEVLPLLERLRGSSAASIAAAASHLREADEALRAWTDEELCRRTRNATVLTEGLARLPRAIRTRLIRRVALAGGVDRDRVGRRLVEQVDRALCGGAPGRAGARRSWDLAQNRRLVLHDGRLEIEHLPSKTSPPPLVSQGARRTEDGENDEDGP